MSEQYAATGLLSGSRCSMRKAARRSGAASRTTIQHHPARASTGRCRRAASIRTRICARRRCANSGKRPASPAPTDLVETDWTAYDFHPMTARPRTGFACFRGQRQKWFALRFTGYEREIDPLMPRNGLPAGVRRLALEAPRPSPISWCCSAARFIGVPAKMFLKFIDAIVHAPAGSSHMTASQSGSTETGPTAMTWQSLSDLKTVSLVAQGSTADRTSAAASARPGRPAAPTATAFQPLDASANQRRHHRAHRRRSILALPLASRVVTSINIGTGFTRRSVERNDDEERSNRRRRPRGCDVRLPPPTPVR